MFELVIFSYFEQTLPHAMLAALRFAALLLAALLLDELLAELLAAGRSAGYIPACSFVAPRPLGTRS